MNIRIIILMVLTFPGLCFAGKQGVTPPDTSLLKNGDIVFQEGFHTQAKAIKAATDSRWTHVGIVFLDNKNRPYVLEAVQPVKITSLENFIGRNPSSFHVMRLKGNDQTITAEMITKAKEYSKSQIGKNYDSRFQWSDDRIYCSELVWKIYNTIGIDLCDKRRFKDYNLKHPTVKKIIMERYGSIDSLPLDEFIVAPSDIAESELLVVIELKQ